MQNKNSLFEIGWKYKNVAEYYLHKNCVPIFDKSLFDGKYNNLPADHFMCEENTLHLGVSDMVTSLILNDLEENETKIIKKKPR